MNIAKSLRNGRTVTVTLIALSALGCSPKSRPRYQHEGPKSVTRVSDPVSVSEVSAQLARFDAEAVKTKFQTLSGDQRAEALRDLAKLVLNQNVLDQPGSKDSRLERALDALNAGMLAMVRDAKSRGLTKIESDLVKSYEATLLAGCSADLRARCLNLEFFTRPASTSQVLLELAKFSDTTIEKEITKAGGPQLCVDRSAECRELMRARYQRIALAWSTKRSRVLDTDLQFQFIKYVAGLRALVERGEVASYMAENYTALFEVIVRRFQSEKVPGRELREFVERFNPWSYSGLKPDLFRSGTKVIFEMASSCCLYTNSQREEISPSMAESILRSQDSDDVDGPSFLSRVKALAARDNLGGPNRIFANLGLEAVSQRILRRDPEFFNEFFFVIDRLFRGHLAASEASQILLKTNPKRMERKFFATLQDYVRMMLVYQVIETNEAMNRIYLSSVASDEIFQSALDQSRDLSSKWGDLTTQVQRLKRFIGEHFNHSSRPPKELSETVNFLNALNRNIHYLSEFPNMISLAFVLNRQRGEIKGRSWWGDIFKFPAETIVSDLLDGHHKSPWFRFAAEQIELERDLLLFAFSYAFKTQAIDLFSKEEGKANPARYIELTLGQYLQPATRSLQEAKEQLTNQLFQSQAGVRLAHVCRYERGESKEMPTLEISITDLGGSTYAGVGETNTLFGAYRGVEIQNFTNQLDDLIKKTVPKLVFARSIVGLLEGYLGANATPELRQGIRRPIYRLESEVRGFLTSVIKARQQFADCANDLYEIELRRAYRLYEEERAHLARVHELLSSLEDIKDSGQLATRIEQINAQHFPKGRYEFDRLQDRTYRLSKYDLLMRMKSHIESDIFTKPTAKEAMVYGADWARLNKPRRVVVYVPDGIKRSDMYLQGEFTPLYYVKDREEFIRQGLLVFNGLKGNFVWWANHFDDLKFFVAKLENTIRLNLLGELSLSGAELGRCGAGESNCEIKHNVGTDQILNEYLQVLRISRMNQLDIEYAPIFGREGRFSTKSFEGFLVEPSSLETWPLYRYLMKRSMELASVDWEGKNLLVEALNIYNTIHTIGLLMLDPGESLKETVRSEYGRDVNERLARLNTLFGHIAKSGDQHLSEFTNLPFRVIDGAVSTLGSSSRMGLQGTDDQKNTDLKELIKKFEQGTQNFFGTREHVLKGAGN